MWSLIFLMFLNFHMPTNTSKASFFLFDLIMFLWYVSVKQSLQKIFLLPLWLFSWFVLYFFESFLFLIQYPNRYWDFLALSVCGKMAVFYVTFLNVVFVYVCILFFFRIGFHIALQNFCSIVRNSLQIN